VREGWHGSRTFARGRGTAADAVRVDDGSHHSGRVSSLSVALDFDHGAEPQRACVLALRRLRRDLERGSTHGPAVRGPTVALSTGELARELEELIAALDRRVPRVEQAGEVAIAREAAALRARAVERLAELAGSSRPPALEREDD